MIHPVYERLAGEGVARRGGGVGFGKVDIREGMGGVIGGEWGIRATPTFMFFLDGKKVSLSDQESRVALI